ncbi:MAG: polysaccharide biosynthesis protein [Oscillospiraceae bacterium]|nr:polysaccharide biosynthesis protein [Oscillospiraceae bacterium]
MFENKTLLITGGTGSFGNAVLSHFLTTDIKEIRVFSRDEKKQDDMRRQYRTGKLKFYIGDVRDPLSILHAMHGVDYVFSAAALKQVPSCEFFPMEAMHTNVEGTYNTLQAAVQCGVKSVVCLSTDKAVYPVNAMGISKALMEKVMVAESRNSEHTIMCATRYGNVMYSRGSVIPLFVEQIQQRMPITVTDPNMTRFLMTLDESVELVLYAFEHANPGDIFVQKAPACTIGDLAKALVRLFEADVPINIIGTRHGEKRNESLLTREELLSAQDMGKYFRIPADTRDLQYAQYFEKGRRDIPDEEYDSDHTNLLSVEGLMDMLMTLQPVRDAVARYKQ